MNILDLIFFGAIIANLVFGFVIFTKGLKSRANRCFALIVLLIIFWLYFSYSATYSAIAQSERAFFWVKMGYGAAAVLPSLLLYFALIFPDDASAGLPVISAVFSPALVFIYLLSSEYIIRSVSFMRGDIASIDFTEINTVFILYFVIYIVLALGVLLKKYFSIKGVARSQIQYVFAGTLIPLAVTAGFYNFAPALGIRDGWYIFNIIGPLSTLFFTGLVTYAISKQRFVGLNVILSKSVVYSMLAGIVTAVYFGCLYLIAAIFQTISGNYSVLIVMIVFFIFAVIFEPLRDRFQEWVDSIFFKSKLDYEKTLKETSAAMSVLSGTERLLKITARLITRRMNLTGAALFWYNDKKDRFEIKGVDGSIKELSGFTMTSNFPLIEALEENKGVLLKSDIEKQLTDIFITYYEKKKLEDVLGDINKLKVSLCVPSMIKDKMVAFLALGEKLSGDPFDEEDLNFLMTLANQSAIFVENSLLLEKEKEAAMKLAEAEAREKYTVMLEKMNKQLIETREELVKAERLSTLTKLSVSLQHEINNPLTSVLAQTQGLLLKLGTQSEMPLDFIKERLQTIEREARRIRELLINLAHITEPIVREYMPGVEMIDIGASAKENEPPR
ncbi:MAG: hypothetical protein NTZ10_06635 [Candidatus Saganbacteria bacterium]|nr:hypothetical protein [Candidatus Saganbacteria bacterium]